ncbi:MAG: hypothetical protein JWN38_631 [Candidatus Saccharibacteria bacterium]|nr:hypothetical protein [Candidatus Saccharibacteria bacterium]
MTQPEQPDQPDQLAIPYADLPEVDADVQPDQTPLTPTITAHEPTPRWKRLAVVGALAGSLIGVGAGGVFAGNAYEKPTASHSTSADLGEEQAPAPLPTVELGTDALRSVFGHALVGDRCATQVTAEDVTDTFVELYGGTDYNHLSSSQLKTEAQNTLQDIREAQKSLDLIPLPDNYDELVIDAGKEVPQIDISVYKQEFTNYAATYGLNTLYDWQVGDPNLVTPPDSDVHPMPLSQQATSRSMRAELLGSMMQLSYIPLSVVQESHVQRIVFGSLTPGIAFGKDAAGYTIFGTHDLNIDIAGNYIVGEGIVSQNTVSHELSHQLSDGLCGGVFSKYIDPNADPKAPDTAYNLLNQGFFYGPTGSAELKAGTYGSLDTAAQPEPGIAAPNTAVVSDYSSNNEAEDQATLLGEKILQVTSMPQLFRDPYSDSILEQKTALQMTRLAKQNPEAGQYYLTLMRAARIEDALLDQQDDLRQQINALLNGDDDVPTVTNSPEYKDLQNQVNDLGSQYSNLQDAMRHAKPGKGLGPMK